MVISDDVKDGSIGAETGISPSPQDGKTYQGQRQRDTRAWVETDEYACVDMEMSALPSIPPPETEGTEEPLPTFERWAKEMDWVDEHPYSPGAASSSDSDHRQGVHGDDAPHSSRWGMDRKFLFHAGARNATLTSATRSPFLNEEKGGGCEETKRPPEVSSVEAVD